MSLKLNKLEKAEENNQKQYNSNSDNKSNSLHVSSQNRPNSKLRKQSWSKHTEVKSHQKQEPGKSQQKNNNIVSKSSTKRMISYQDKKALQNDKALSKRKLQQTESQQNASLKQKSKSKLLHSESKSNRIKISGRKVKQPQPTYKAEVQQSSKTQSLLQHQQIITEIANQIKLDTFESKAAVKAKEGDKVQHSFPDIKESVSQIEASPSGKQQSAIFAQSRTKQNNLSQTGPQANKGNFQNLSSEISRKKNHKQGLQLNIDQRLQLAEKQLKKLQHIHEQTLNKLKIQGNTINLKVEQIETKVDSNGLNQFNEEITILRQTVRDLRLQKVKAKAERYDDYSLQQKTLEGEEQFSRKFNTINTLVNELESEIDKGQTRAQICLGRIVKNKYKSQAKRSVNSYQLGGDIALNGKQGGNIFLRSNNKEFLQEKSFPQLNSLNFALSSQPSRFSIDAAEIKQSIKTRMIFKRAQNCEKLIDKFNSTQHKFKYFVNRQKTKSAHKFSKTFLKSDFQQAKHQNSIQNAFQGTIIKNLVKPSIQNEQVVYSTTVQSKFMDFKIVSAIKAAELKNIEKKGQNFTRLDVPQIPNPPQYNSSLQQMMESILKVLPLAKVAITKKQLSGCSLKKYKNCIMLGLPQNDRFKLVWHFTGKLFMGEWNNQTNEKAGQGLQIISLSQLYEGEFSSGKKYGKGIHIQTHTSIYEGDFINGEKHGKGKCLNKAENSLYEGEWCSGKMEGFGYFQSEGNIFQGQFKRNLKEGFGVQQFQNGDRYIGEYRNDKFEGQGKYIWANGSSYLGHFKESNRDGFGKWVSEEEFSQIYVGFYMNDKKHGSGKYRWKNGCIYEGNFDQDKKYFFQDIGTEQGVCNTLMEEWLKAYGNKGF